jgi:hypothetical protein
VNHGHGYVYPAVLTLAAAVVSAFIKVVVDEMSVFEVESMLFQIREPLCLIPDKHD